MLRFYEGMSPLYAHPSKHTQQHFVNLFIMVISEMSEIPSTTDTQVRPVREDDCDVLDAVMLCSVPAPGQGCAPREG